MYVYGSDERSGCVEAPPPHGFPCQQPSRGDDQKINDGRVKSLLLSQRTPFDNGDFTLIVTVLGSSPLAGEGIRL